MDKGNFRKIPRDRTGDMGFKTKKGKKVWYEFNGNKWVRCQPPDNSKEGEE